MDEEKEDKLIEAMAEADLDTLRIMSDTGVSELTGIHGHIEALHSKNATLLGLSLGIISIVLVFSLEFDWLERPEMIFPLSLFSILMCISVISGLVLFLPWDYSDSDLYNNDDIYGNLKKTPRTILEDHIITVKDALDDCSSQYGRDVKMFQIGVTAFIMALAMLFMGLF